MLISTQVSTPLLSNKHYYTTFFHNTRSFISNYNSVLSKLFLNAGFLSYSVSQVGCTTAYDMASRKYELECGGAEGWIQNNVGNFLSHLASHYLHNLIFFLFSLLSFSALHFSFPLPLAYSIL